jgi:hypothetical protein
MTLNDPNDPKMTQMTLKMTQMTLKHIHTSKVECAFNSSILIAV